MILSKKQIKSQEKLNKIEKMRNYILNIIQRDESGAISQTINKDSKSEMLNPDAIQLEQLVNKKQKIFNIRKKVIKQARVLRFKREPFILKFIKKNVKIKTVFISFFVGIILCCLLFAILIFYIPRTESLFARKISKVIPFPAIIINGRFISYNDYLAEVDAVNIFLTRQKNSGVIQDVPPRSQTREEIATLLIRQAIIKNLADEYKITVSQKEIDDEINKLKEKSRSEESFDAILKDLYGWREQEFGTRVIKNYLFASKLSDKIFPDIPGEESKELFNKKIEETKEMMNIFVLVK